jgi:uncharacterized membrane protein YeaQ/YmgE (transglycosylase-associated protein family)
MGKTGKTEKGVILGIIAWIVLGLLAGMLAKAILPGAQSGGLIVTTVIGILGAVIGGFVARALGFGDPIDEFFDISTWLAAVIGAIALLVAWGMISGRERRLV